MNKELNKKLAEYFGIIERRKVINTGREDEEYEDEAYFLVETNERVTFNLVQVGFYAGFPPFTESLDACVKWLVPEANRKFGVIRIEFAYFWEKTGCNITTDKQDITAQCNLDELGGKPKEAIALCLAFEKLIDAK